MSSRALVAAGYREAEAVTRRHAKSFSFASAFLFGARRRAAFALYAICRRLDDVVDTPSTGTSLTLRLSEARQAIARVYGEGGAKNVATPWSTAEHAAFQDTVDRYHVPRRALDDLVAGMEMDLSIHRYASWEELDVYCYRVAGTVGLMMASVLGTTERWALVSAVELGKAMQLTNILRDVKEDLDRGRIYLPLDELSAFDLREADLRAGRVDDRFRAFMRCQIARARALFVRGAAGIGAIRGVGARATVRVMCAVYAAILDAIEQADYDVFSQRVHVPTRGKVAIAARALIARAIPAEAATTPLPLFPRAAKD